MYIFIYRNRSWVKNFKACSNIFMRLFVNVLYGKTDRLNDTHCHKINQAASMTKAIEIQIMIDGPAKN